MRSLISWSHNRIPTIKVNGVRKQADHVKIPDGSQDTSGYWIAKLSRYKVGKPQIQIVRLGPLRKYSHTFANGQTSNWTSYDGKLKLCVSAIGKIKMGYGEDDANVGIRTVGLSSLSFPQFEELKAVIEEATFVLEHLDVR